MDQKSPVKEKILTTFAQLTPIKETKGSGVISKTDTLDREETSWLTNVKGKFAKTVEKEKGSVPKGSDIGNSSGLERDGAETEGLDWKMSCSLSEDSFSEYSKPSKETQRPQSQIFDFDITQCDFQKY